MKVKNCLGYTEQDNSQVIPSGMNMKTQTDTVSGEKKIKSTILHSKVNSEKNNKVHFRQTKTNSSYECFFCAH